MSRVNIRQEILDELKTLNTKLNNLMCALQQFYYAADGSDTYQNDALTGNTVRNIYCDGLLMNTDDWALDSATGTITYTNNIPANGIQVLIQYN